MNYQLLLITDDDTAAAELKAALEKEQKFLIEHVRVNTLADGLKRLYANSVHLVLVDAFLPDSKGVASLDRLLLAAPDVPVLVLYPSDQDELAVRAIEHGAQACLPRDQCSNALMPQSLRNAILRKSLYGVSFVENRRAELTLASIADCVACTDTWGNVNYMNAAAEQMTGWKKQEALGRPFSEVFQIIAPKTSGSPYTALTMAIKQNVASKLRTEMVLIRRDGYETPVEDSVSPLQNQLGQVIGAVVVFHDVGVARDIAKKMAHQAYHDALTDLPNRVLLHDRITQAIEGAKRSGTHIALLFVDMDNFKIINDTLGHVYGDRLLRSVACRLIHCVRSSDTVSRQGGDEFVILLAEDKVAEDAAITAEKILACLEEPHHCGGHMLNIAASIGISVYPADGTTPEVLIQSADTAMYLAKKLGGNNYQFFAPEMNARALERQLIESNLRNALRSQEFVLYYQAKVNLKSGLITGAEALLRWRHPERGLLLPGQFVTIAEECGLMVPIGLWVLREACRQAKDWSRGPARVPISINISGPEFRSADFLDNLRATLNEFELEPDLLELELTETALLRDTDASTCLLAELKEIGVGLAVDDFGTGYSSLSYLRQFPIDTLKIDRSFVREAGTSKEDGIILNAVIGMGRSLHQRVVAEGIELEDQVDFLNDHDCEEGQGHYFSKPLLADQFSVLLTTGIDTARVH
ncbi:hypothetical protein BH11PSE11_BH11PSE11_35710 [soil metagenome]